MALDPQSLFAVGNCYICFGATEEDTIELALLATIAVNGITPTGDFLTTQLGEPLITQAGDNLTWD